MTAVAQKPAAPRGRVLWLGVVVLAAAIVAALTVFSNGAQSVGTLVTRSGEHAITVEIADTPEGREIGLMNRQSMPADQGMLFDFMETRPVSMWMKNTYIPLDMVFMDEQGIVTHIAINAQPLSLDIIPSRGSVRYVLELNGGAAARFGLKPGDRLEHPLIGASSK